MVMGTDEEACFLVDPPQTQYIRSRRFRPMPVWQWSHFLNEISLTISQSYAFSQKEISVAPSIMAGVPHVLPVNFARAPDGSVFFTNGLMPMMKWNGLRYGARTVGVQPPTTAPTLAVTATAASTTATTTQYEELANETVQLSLAWSGDVTDGVTVSGSWTGKVSGTVTGTYQEAGQNLIVSATATVTGDLSGTLTGWIYGPSVRGTDPVPAQPWTFSGTLSGSLSGSGTGTVSGTINTIGSSTILGTFSGTVTGSSVSGDTTDQAPPISGTYSAYVRFVDDEGHYSNLSPISNEVSGGAPAAVEYTDVAVPTEAKIARKQILRNTSGQAQTYYVDIDTTDLAATSFTSTRSDADLATQESVSLFDEEGNDLGNIYTVPPNHKPLLASFLDRMFGAGEATYQDGNIIVTFGSTTVTGIGTEWTSALEGRFLYVVGTGRSYQIGAVDTAAQTLTLLEAYQNTTDSFAVYAIRPPPAVRRNLYFTEAGLYEAWPAFNALTLEDNGDETTALVSAESFLYIFQRRHIYRLTYNLGPFIDGGLFRAAERGVVNNRSWVYLDGMIYALDEQGVYRFQGGREPEHLSLPIQDIFWVNHDDDNAHINWKAQRWFHAIHTKDESCIRWFVALSGSRLPRHALCFNYAVESWWIEEYPFPVGASCQMEQDIPRPIAAGPARRVFAQSVGTLDGPDALSGTTRGTATAITTMSLVDGLAVFPTSGLAGSPVVIVEGTGKGQTNLIASVSGTTLTLVQPWLVTPDTTSVYQIGGVAWRWRSGLYRMLREEGDQQRRIEMIFKPCAADAQMDVRIFKDHASAADKWGRDWPPSVSDRDGVYVTDEEADARVDLTESTGFAQVRLSGRRERYVEKADVVAVELAGVSGVKPITVYEVNVEGAEP